VVKLAVPPFRVTVPIGAPPSEKVTVPVGTPVPDEIVAVNVTGCPKTDGLGEEITAVEVVAASTVRVAVAVFPVPAVVSVTVTLLTSVPGVTPCMFNDTVHEAPCASVAPFKLTELPPATAVPVPPHVLEKLLGVATAMPAGSKSLNATPFRLRFAFEFEIVKVRLVVAPALMLDAPKLSAIFGGLITVSVAEEVLPIPASVELIVTLLV
jgi:hypothetical protein